MIERLLAKLDLRDPLGQEERAALSAAFDPVATFRARDVLTEQGSQPGKSTLLLNGLTGRVTTVRDGGQQITALHLAGDFVDLHSFLIKVMDHSIVAISDCQVTTIRHERLRDLTTRFPHLARLLWFSTLIDAAIHRQWLVAMGRLSALSQTAHLICELTVRLETVGLALRKAFELPISQLQLADALGLTSVHLNRMIQELRSRRLLTWSGQRVEILDWDGLVQLAEFDPTYLQLERISL